MKQGDISNHPESILAFSLDDVFNYKSRGWWDNVLMKWTNGRWALLAPVLFPLPGALKVLNTLADNFNLYFLVIESKLTRQTAIGIMNQHHIPSQEVDIVLRREDLRDYMADHSIHKFLTRNVEFAAHAGSVNSVFSRWDDVTT